MRRTRKTAKQSKPGRFLSSRERHKVADPVCDLSSFVFVVSRIAVPMLVILNKYVRGRERSCGILKLS